MVPERYRYKDCYLDAAGWVQYPHPGSVLGWGPGAYAKREELLQKDKFDQRQLLHCKARRGEFNTTDSISSATGSGDSPHPGSILGWGCLAYAQREALLQDAKMTMRNYKMQSRPICLRGIRYREAWMEVNMQ